MYIGRLHEITAYIENVF